MNRQKVNECRERVTPLGPKQNEGAPQGMHASNTHHQAYLTAAFLVSFWALLRPQSAMGKDDRFSGRNYRLFDRSTGLDAMLVDRSQASIVLFTLKR